MAWDHYLHPKDWGVDSNHVPVALLSVKLDCEATNVTKRVTGSSLTSDSGEAHKDWGLGARRLKELGTGEMRQIRSHLCS